MITLINPGNQQGLRYLFDIVDPQSNPENIDMSAIQPVIDMNFGGFAKLNDYGNSQNCQQPSSSIAGVQSKTWRILSHGNAVGADQQVVVPVRHNFFLWGHKLDLYFDAAGAGAFNGKWITCEILLWCPDGTELCKYHASWQVSTGYQLYAPGGKGAPPLNMADWQVIPYGSYVELVFWVQDGSNFPANTRVKYMLYGIAYPSGAPLPGQV